MAITRKLTGNTILRELVKSPRYMQLRGMVRRKYRCMEAGDAEGEMNLGICLAAQSVKMNVGDPMEFLLSRGWRHVQGVASMILNHTIMEECLWCHHWRPYRRNPCSKCKCIHFIIHRRVLPLDTNDDGSLVFEENRRRTKPKMQS